MDLGLWRRQLARPSTRATVTIQRADRLYLNRAAKNLIGESQFVTLFFNDATHAVGLRAAAREDAEGYRLTAGGDGSAWTISCKAFIRAKRLRTGQRYDARPWSPNGLLFQAEVVPPTDGTPDPSRGSPPSAGDDDRWVE